MTMEPEQQGGIAILEAPVVVPQLTGDHDRMSHIVLEGYRGEDGYVDAQPTVLEGFVNKVPVRALCGKVWIPEPGKANFPLCPTCEEIAAARKWRLPAA